MGGRAKNLVLATYVMCLSILLLFLFWVIFIWTLDSLDDKKPTLIGSRAMMMAGWLGDGCSYLSE